MVGFIALCVALSLFFLSMTFVALREPEKVSVRERLQKIAGQSQSEVVDIRDAELQQPLMDRMLRPVLTKITGLLGRMMPAAILENLQPKLNRAGNPWGLSAGEFLTIKMLVLVLLVLFSIPLLVGGEIDQFILIVAAGALAIWALPDYYLKTLAQKRRDDIEKSMPDILDLLTVSVEAGYGWDGALQKVTEKREGPLAQEFQRVTQETKMGKPRKDAMRDMSRRVDIDCVTTFVMAIIQADQLGLSLSYVLRTQSEQIRQKRRQEVEEEAMKAPIKMLLPLVLFIFPVIFIILLGPALVQILETLG